MLSLVKINLAHQIAAQYHFKYFGHAKEIQSCVLDGKRHVLLADGFFTSNNSNENWKSPQDFLISYLKSTLGNDWFNCQVKLPESDRHLIISWALDAKITVHDPNNPIESSQLNGSAFSFLHLAYDLFVIENHGYFKDRTIIGRLIEDLKKMASFNGARYEIFVFATLIRAGFELKLHDQLKLNQGKITECKATHIETNTHIQVEAKGRNIKGVLGAQQGNPDKVRLYDKMRSAVEKDVKDPYIVFIDINSPEISFSDEGHRIQIRKEYEKLEENFPEKLPNLICLTNIPYHYESDDILSKVSSFCLIPSKFPRVKLDNESNIKCAIEIALHQHSNLPKCFNESRLVAEKELGTNKFF